MPKLYKYQKDDGGSNRTDCILILNEWGYAFVPEDEGNRFWQEFQEWLDLGNTPDAAD